MANQIQEYISLKHFNTFGIEAKARFFLTVNAEEDLINIIPQIPSGDKIMILGGGSNILLTGDYDGWVIKNNLSGIEIESETESEVVVGVGSGVNWHDWVMYTLEKGWYGLENLSLIPGSVGAAPMQNIGAYGAEIKQSFVYLEGVFLRTGIKKKFMKEECEFGYRESIFKRSVREFFITRVCFRLSKKSALNTGYGDIQKELEKLPYRNFTPRDVSNAVISIRRSKLPDPEVIGNAGSFFKNPTVSESVFLNLKTRFPDIPHYPAEEGKVKIPAAWLIQQCGWKGQRFGNFGVHEKQALVLVNYGGATGNEILKLSEEIIRSVHLFAGIELEREVNII